MNFSSTFSSSSLKEGSNTFRVFGMKTAAAIQQVLIDWVDVDYFSSNDAINDSIYIRIPDSIASKVREIKVTNLTSTANNLIVYKVKPFAKRISNFSVLTGTKNTLVFSDTVSGGDAYFIVKNDYIKSPDFKIKKQFINLRNSSNGADDIIISNKILSESANAYNNFVNSTYNVRTKLIFVDDIYDEFYYGFNHAEAIKSFLIYANQNWQKPSPTYLTLIGDANYDYKDIWSPVPAVRKKNLVPSYGDPVSDVWFVTWDSSNVNIPQMFVGRIPANSNSEVYHYLDKHKSYLERGFDEWNKSFLFFSGGDPADANQLAQIKAANDDIFNNLVKPAPVGGTGIHFYKTINPPTNFGPYSQQTIQSAINNSGLFISYIGHSGTQTWDNGITSVEDLKNSYSNRFPLMTDFGCSTGKFAEPDVDAFGELFISESPDGQAINYLGNTSFGYLSTSLRFPKIFYSKLLIDTITVVSEAHLLSKIQQFQQYGYSDVNRVFSYCNLLFGDPMISLRLPKKPNFEITSADISIEGENPTEFSDSVMYNLNIKNLGRVFPDSLQIHISDQVKDSLLFQKDFSIAEPLFEENIQVEIPLNNSVGEHVLTVTLDRNNKIEELNEADNVTEFLYNVYSASFRPLLADNFYSTVKNKLRLLNPSLKTKNSSNAFVFSLADNLDFKMLWKSHIILIA